MLLFTAIYTIKVGRILFILYTEKSQQERQGKQKNKTVISMNFL